VSAGYSGTPLPRKLGIADGSAFTLVDAPEGAAGLLEPLPHGARPVSTPAEADVVLVFVTERTALERQLGGLARAIFPDGTLWVAWPKRASKVPTDVTEDVVRDVALPLGLVDVKVAAVDATWSGLKLVWRRERRSG
jgi:hypothetical protein